jgi:hypothetical protein
VLSRIDVNNRQSVIDWENSNSKRSVVEHIIYPS